MNREDSLSLNVPHHNGGDTDEYAISLNAYVKNRLVSTRCIQCDTVGMISPADLLPDYIQRLISILLTRNEDNGFSGISIPRIKTGWRFDGSYTAMENMIFMTKIRYIEKARIDSFVIPMKDKTFFLVRPDSFAIFYNIVSAITTVHHQDSIEDIMSRLGNALMALIKALFIDHRYPATMIKSDELYENNDILASPQSFIDPPRTEKDEEDEEDIITDFAIDDNLEKILRRTEAITKLPKGIDILYYGRVRTSLFMYIDVIRDNELIDAIMEYYRRHMRSFRHELELISLADYVTKKLFITEGDGEFITNDTRWREYSIVTPGYDKKWERIIEHYHFVENKKENESSSSLLVNMTPYIHHLNDPLHVSVALTTRERETGITRMIGYVTCTLEFVKRPHLKTTDGSTEFYNRDITQFATTPHSEDENAIFNIYHINGLHVAHNARRAGLSRLLVYYAMLFIKKTYKELGVLMVTCDAASYPTWRILERYGFSHYDEAQSLSWIRKLLDSLSDELSEEVYYTDITRNKVSEMLRQIKLHCITYNNNDSIYSEHERYEVIEIAIERLESTQLVNPRDFVDTITDELRYEFEAISLSLMSNMDDNVSPSITKRYIDKVVADSSFSGMTTFLYLDKNKENYKFEREMMTMASFVENNGFKVEPDDNISRRSSVEGNTSKRARRHDIEFSAEFIDSLNFT